MKSQNLDNIISYIYFNSNHIQLEIYFYQNDNIFENHIHLILLINDKIQKLYQYILFYLQEDLV